jgi:hypothetical protein
MDGDFADDNLEEFFKLRKTGWRRRRYPAVDETLYFL